VAVPDLRPEDARNGIVRPQTVIPPEEWPELIAFVRERGLRAAGRRWGVSAQTVWKTVRRATNSPSPLTAIGGPRAWTPQYKIAPEDWPTVAESAAKSGLRKTAAEYGISTFTVAEIKKRVQARG